MATRDEILAAAQRKNPEAGFATDFVDPVMRQVLPEVVKRGIQVITNAGGIHPQACARALHTRGTCRPQAERRAHDARHRLRHLQLGDGLRRCAGAPGAHPAGG